MTKTKAQVRELARDVKAQAQDVAGQARGFVQTYFVRQKDQAADRLGSLASALREAGRKLDEAGPEGEPNPYTVRAAHQVDRLATYLRHSDLDDFVRDTENFARRRPEVFLGGALVAGLMLGRFLKASSPGYELGGSGYDGGAPTGYPQRSRSTRRAPSTPSWSTPGVAQGDVVSDEVPAGV